MKRRIISLVLILGLVITSTVTSTAMADKATSTMTAETTAVVNNPDPDDRLNLRTRPSEDAPTLGKYYNGTFVEVLKDGKDGWMKVRIFTLEGYMMAKFLVAPDQIPIGAATIPAVKIKNTGGAGLNLRKAQSMNSASLGLYKNGQTVRVFGLSETWCHVQTEDGKVGFMLREQLSPVPQYHKESTATAQDGFGTVHNPNPQDRLHLRTEPSERAPSLGKYYNGVAVTLLGDVKDGWVKVQIGNLKGFMNAEFLETGRNQQAVASAMPYVTVSNAGGTGLHLRETQSTSSKSRGLLNNGSTVLVYGVGETWCHVEAPDGKVGFMLREKLSPVLEFNKN